MHASTAPVSTSTRPDASDGYAAWAARLAEGIDTRFYPAAYIDARLAEGTAFFFATDRAAIVVELKRYPSGLLAVHGLVAAGARAEIASVLIPAAEQWGKANGASVGIIESRPGWAKALKAQGYRVFQTSIAKEL